ncbi:MAG: hypothetical protein HYY24_07130 [Verrucomicrobia bacterium]|nr:hypothetical protein [Verrucomicrobiota bacterium]
MTFLGLDLGTSFIKAATLDLDALTVGPVQRVPFPAPLVGLPPLCHEVDPTSVLAATRELLDLLAAQTPHCAGLVLCGQMGGLVLTNERGEALSNYISWLDKRALQPHPSGTGSVFDALLHQLSTDDWRRLGREVRPGLPLSFLFWLAEHGQRPSPGTFAATLPDFVLANLCGCAPVTHFTNAVGALNLETLDWHRGLFARLGLSEIRWPALRDVREPVGHLRINAKTLSCYPPVGDHQCALLGAGLDFGELSLNISTGSQVSLLTERWEPGDYQTRPFFDGRFLNTITNLPAGRALNLLLDLLTELPRAQRFSLEDPWAFVVAEAAKATATDLRAHLSFFPSPVGDSGTLTNIREDNFTVGQLFRAAFVDMAENYFTTALRLSPAQAWRRVVFSGGLAQKTRPLRELIREKFQRAARVRSSEDETLRGLLAVALVSSGRVENLAAAVRVLGRMDAPAA